MEPRKYRKQVFRGFVRGSDGTITAFHKSGSIGTYAWSINAKGSITGYYVGSDNARHGFVRVSDGKIASFDPSICTL